jgi:hypothetical protein
VQTSVSLGQDVVAWRQSKPTSKTLQEEAAVTQFTQNNHGILAVDHTALDTTETENDV